MDLFLVVFVYIFIHFGRRKKSMEKFRSKILARIHGSKKNPCPTQNTMKKGSMEKSMPALAKIHGQNQCAPVTKKSSILLNI